VAVEPLDERATVRMAELVRDVLRRQLEVVEQPRRAEVPQLVEVDRRLAKPTADRMPVVVLHAAGDRPAAARTEDQLVSVEGARHL
jgi:hypothetical protein